MEMEPNKAEEVGLAGAGMVSKEGMRREVWDHSDGVRRGFEEVVGEDDVEGDEEVKEESWVVEVDWFCMNE
jgi:hypothetical protein